MITSLAYVSVAAARGLDPDEPLLMTAFAELGVAAEVCNWDDPTCDWSRFDRVVLRAAWDYPERLDEFLAWIDRAAAVAEVRNSPALVRWSLDKHYLAELAAAGVAIPPTRFVEPGDVPVLPVGPAGFVVKPAVGAGSRDAARYEGTDHDRESAIAHVDRLHRVGRSVLVQPFLESVPRLGEWPLVFLDGEFSHAANKRVALPRAGAVEGLFAAEDNRPAEVSRELVAVGRAAIEVAAKACGEVPLYGRVDLVLDDAGTPCVLEVELVEPSLFLPEHRAATPRVARAFVA